MKLISDNIINTLSLASHLHRNHTRHDDRDTPYISHLAAVSMYLQCVTDDENIIMAGIMHDSIEDVPDYTYDDLVRDCGVRVADIVSSVTENKSLPYKEMKLDYINKVRNSGPETLLISLADKLHNAKSLSTMPADKIHKGHLWLYEEILKLSKDKIEKCISMDETLIDKNNKANKTLIYNNKVLSYKMAGPLIEELEKTILNLKSITAVL